MQRLPAGAALRHRRYGRHRVGRRYRHSGGRRHRTAGGRAGGGTERRRKDVRAHHRGYRIYIQEQATDLVAFTIHDICAQMADGDRERTGRCVLAFVRSLDVSGSFLGFDFNDQLDHMAKSRRADDIMDAIEEVRSGEASCLTAERTWGWGGDTNWTTRGSSDTHCDSGVNPLDEADPRGALDDLPVELSYDLLESFIENPEPVIAAVASQSPERARQLRNLHESLGDHLDLDTLLEEVEDALE